MVLTSCDINDVPDDVDEDSVVELTEIYLTIDGDKEVMVYEYERDGMDFLIFDEWGGEGMHVVNMTKEKLEVEVLLKEKMNQ